MSLIVDPYVYCQQEFEGSKDPLLACLHCQLMLLCLQFAKISRLVLFHPPRFASFSCVHSHRSTSPHHACWFGLHSVARNQLFPTNLIGSAINPSPLINRPMEIDTCCQREVVVCIQLVWAAATGKNTKNCCGNTWVAAARK